MPFPKRYIAKILLFIGLILGLFVSQFVIDISRCLSPAQIQEWLMGAGKLAPILYMVMMSLAVVISPIPSLPLDIAAGAFFGPILGTIYSAAAGLTGAVISFMIARSIGRELIERFIGGHINFCTDCSDKLVTKIVFFSRLVPVLSFDIISYGAGLTKISLKKFSLATFFGMLPLTFIYNYFGAVLIIGKGLAIILGTMMVILFFLMPKWIERYNLFSLMKLFQHPPGQTNCQD